MKKRTIAKVLIITLLSSLLMVTPAFAKEHTVSSEAAFRQALAQATDGDTIHVSGSVVVTPLDSDDNLFVINKKLTITGDTLILRDAGVILGDDVTFENMTLDLPNVVRNAVFANGYKLTMNNVDFESGKEMCSVAVSRTIWEPILCHRQEITDRSW